MCASITLVSISYNQNMSIAWKLLIVGVVLTVILDVFQIGNVASIYDRSATYDSDVIDPGNAPAAPLSRIEFWAQFLPLLLLNDALMMAMIRIVFPTSRGWKYVHIVVSALWALAALIMVIWIWIVIVPNCNSTANNLCTDQRYCCKFQTISPATNVAAGCPIFQQACDPDQSAVTLGWNSGFTWLFVLLWIDVLIAIVHIALTWWLGSSSSMWIAGKDMQIYSPIVENKMESGTMGLVSTSVANRFVPVATGPTSTFNKKA